MKTDLNCVQCFIRQAINVGRLATDDPKIQEEIVRQTITQLLDFNLKKVPVEIAWPIHKMIKELSNNPDPYRKIKEESNLQASELLPFIQEQIGEDWTRAIQLLCVANIIDFGPFSPTNDLKGFISDKLAIALPRAYPTEKFISSIKQNSKILYIADNCGEIIFDLFFIEHFLQDKKVYLAVRSQPILNDVALADIEKLSLPSNVILIDSGVETPGAVLEKSTPEFQKLYTEVPLVIAKGQGNYEALSETPRPNLYYLLITKCSVIAADLKAKVGIPLIKEAISEGK